MRTHGRYPYSAIAHRAPFAWPNGARLAVFVAVNLAFPFGEGHGIPLVNPMPEPDVQNFGFRDWGNRVGVWNLLDALDEHAIPPPRCSTPRSTTSAPRSPPPSARAATNSSAMAAPMPSANATWTRRRRPR